MKIFERCLSYPRLTCRYLVEETSNAVAIEEYGLGFILMLDRAVQLWQKPRPWKEALHECQKSP